MNQNKQKKIIIGMAIALVMMLGLFNVEFINWDKEHNSVIAPVELEGQEKSDTEYEFSWKREKYPNRYELIKYDETTGEYTPYKTIENTGDDDMKTIDMAKEVGKYKIRTIVETEEGEISVDSENCVEINQEISNAPKYDSITVVKEIGDEDVNLIAEATGSDNASHAQSICYTPDGYVVALVNRGNSAGCLQKFNKRGILVRTMETGSIGHANGCTYNPNTESVYIMQTYAGRRKNEIKVFDAKNLAEKESCEMKTCPSGVGYDRQTNQFYFTASDRIYITDESLNRKTTIHRKRWKKSQDVCGYNGIIFSCIWLRGNDSFIDMYNSYDGGYLGSISVPLGEIEGLCVDDGYLVILLNGGNIYKTKNRVDFYKN